MEWMHTARWTYNRAVAAIRAEPALESDEPALRRRFVNKTGLASLQAEADTSNLTTTPASKHKDLSWVLRTPSFIRNSAIAEAVLAYRTNRAKEEKRCEQARHHNDERPRKKQRKKKRRQDRRCCCH